MYLTQHVVDTQIDKVAVTQILRCSLFAAHFRRRLTRLVVAENSSV